MKSKILLSLVIGVFFLVATTPFIYGSRWILSSNSGQLPDDLASKVQQAGGTLISTLGEMGVAFAEFSNRSDAESLEAHGMDVMVDIEAQWIPEDQNSVFIEDTGIQAVPGTSDTYYRYQWHHPVIHSDQAWAAGVFGNGVRVAVIDTGIWYKHPDLKNNIDYAASISLVPGITDFLDDNGHGTHVSGIIAAAANNWGSVGVAPQATLIGIKVFDSTGRGPMSRVVQGIYHAISQNAQVINMSLGTYVKKNGYAGSYTARDAQKIIKLNRKAVTYATSHGALVVCSAGNESIDMDHNQNIIGVPSECANAISISATGPIGLQDFDHFASYSCYGNSAIWVAAPGGDSINYPNAGWYYDMVFSTTINGWSWMSGTSMAAPMVSGVAALILSKYGPMSPGELKNRIAQTADDLGKPGHDPYYGRGRVNAYRAVTD